MRYAIIIGLVLAASAAEAQVTCQRIGNQQYCSNGVTSQDVGQFRYYNDGTTRQTIGQFQYYSAPPVYTPPPPVFMPAQPTPYQWQR